MAETLTVAVDDGHTYTVTVRNVALFSDSGLTTPVTFPQSVSADTTWYAAAPTVRGKRRPMSFLVTDVDGNNIPVDSAMSLPAFVELPEGQLSYVAASPSGGSSTVPTAVKTANYTAANGDAVLGDASGGAFTVTLPTPASGALVTVKNTGATGTVTVAPHAAETIDGAASLDIGTSLQSRDFLSDGTDWWVV